MKIKPLYIILGIIVILLFMNVKKETETVYAWPDESTCTLVTNKDPSTSSWTTFGNSNAWVLIDADGDGTKEAYGYRSTGQTGSTKPILIDSFPPGTSSKLRYDSANQKIHIGTSSGYKSLELNYGAAANAVDICGGTPTCTYSEWSPTICPASCIQTRTIISGGASCTDTSKSCTGGNCGSGGNVNFRTYDLTYSQGTSSQNAIAYTDTCGNILTAYGLSNLDMVSVSSTSCPTISGQTLLISGIPGNIPSGSGVLCLYRTSPTQLLVAQRYGSTSWRTQTYDTASSSASKVDTSSTSIDSSKEMSCQQCTPVNCVWGPWSVWSACSSGIQTRTRSKTTVESCGGTCSGSSIESQSCTVTCTSFTYGSWTPSTSTVCSGQTFPQTRSVLSSAPSGCTGGSPITSQTATGTKTCTCSLPWGGTLANGASITAYQVSSGTSCPSQTRTCSNGVLSGIYQYQSCTITGNCNTNADTNCNGCVSDSEFPGAVSMWKNQNGISDSEFPTVVAQWKQQVGC